jgi:hypothetical protein
VFWDEFSAKKKDGRGHESKVGLGGLQ